MIIDGILILLVNYKMNNNNNQDSAAAGDWKNKFY
jgi:hypothetical protein